MAIESGQIKWTEAQIKAQIEKIEQIIDKHRHENKGEHFTAATPDQIERKLKRAGSPMIVSQGWSSSPPGGTFNYGVGIYNPDPTQAVWLFAHVWVGSGNVDPTAGTFLLNADARFPRLTQPKFDGLGLAPGAAATLNFSIKVSSSVEKTNYLGNSCLMQFNWHDVGKYLDRGVFVFEVV